MNQFPGSSRLGTIEFLHKFRDTDTMILAIRELEVNIFSLTKMGPTLRQQPLPCPEDLGLPFQPAVQHPLPTPEECTPLLEQIHQERALRGSEVLLIQAHQRGKRYKLALEIHQIEGPDLLDCKSARQLRNQPGYQAAMVQDHALGGEGMST